MDGCRGGRKKGRRFPTWEDGSREEEIKQEDDSGKWQLGQRLFRLPIVDFKITVRRQNSKIAPQLAIPTIVVRIRIPDCRKNSKIVTKRLFLRQWHTCF
jgi:hypothetical protein